MTRRYTNPLIIIIIIIIINVCCSRNKNTTHTETEPVMKSVVYRISEYYL